MGKRSREVELDVENKKLKKRVARLRKQAQEAVFSDPEDPDLLIEEEPDITKKCPLCSNQLTTFETPNGTKMLACPSCKEYRQRVEAK